MKKPFSLKMSVIGLLLTLSCPQGAAAAEIRAARGEVDFSSTLPPTSIRLIDWPTDNEPSSVMTIMKGTTQVFRFDRKIVRVAVSDPLICDVTNAGERDILINSKDAGNANLIVWDEKDAVATYQLQSMLDVDKLRTLLLSIDPAADIRIIPFNKTVAVYGSTETSLKLKQIQDATKAFDEKVVNFVKLREPKQVLLEVRFAEVDRRHNKEFKYDFQAISRYYSVNSYIGQTGGYAEAGDSSLHLAGSPTTYDSLVSGLGTQSVSNFMIPYTSSTFYLTHFLKFLEQKNILRVIARPNLLAKDGEEASFLVGGEYPVPTTSSTSGTTISYKDYGTQLKFTPEVLDDEILRLKVYAESSELDSTTSVTSGGVSVPGLTKRTESTVAELRENETLVIAGIITQRVTKINRKIPILGDIPVLGRPFNADEYERVDIELLVIITPHIVRPMKLEETKKLYNPAEVKDAVRIIAPPYPERAADAMDHMMTEGESYRDLELEDHEAELKARRLAKERKELEKAAKAAQAAQIAQAAPAPVRNSNIVPAVSSKDYSSQRLKAPVAAPAAPQPPAASQPASSSGWSWPWKKSAAQPADDASGSSDADATSGPILTNFTSKVKTTY